MTSWTSRLQQWWWKITARKHKAHSHSSVYIGKNNALNREQEAEANIWVDITTFRHNQEHMDLWQPIAREQHVIEAINEVLDAKEEGWYGFISWFTIVLVGILHWLFPKKNVKGWKFWDRISAGTICTEFVWEVLEKIANKEIIYKGTTQEAKGNWASFLIDLHKTNRNVFTPPDLVELLLKHYKCWEYYGSFNNYMKIMNDYYLATNKGTRAIGKK